MITRLYNLLTLLTIISLSAIPSMAQSGQTTVSGTIADGNGTLYINSPYTVTFYDPGTSGKLPLLNGSTFQKSYSGLATNSSGVLSISLPDNNVIASTSGATGTQWTFSICTAAASYTTIFCIPPVTITITGGSQDISAAVTAVAPLLPTTLSNPFIANGHYIGINTFKSINGVITVGTAAGQYASLQAAHDSLPSSGGTVFVTATGTPFGAAGTTALTITKSIHVIFDQGNFTYSGAGAQAISCSIVRGIILEGSGRRGDDIGTAGTTITISNTAANGINAAACNGITIRDFNLIGPGSGTGKGVLNSSGRATYSNLNISGWGSDGWTNDGSSNNANSVLVSKVRSSANGGNGFVTKGANGQLVTFIEADGSINIGDGFNIANQLNVFQGTNADGNTGYDYHFVSGGTGNTGNIFSNNAGAGPPGGIQFDAGANSNIFTQMGSGGTLAVTSGLGTNNMVWSQAQTTYTSGDNNMTLGLSSGVGAGIRGSSINFQDNNVNKWTVQKTASNLFVITNPGVLDMFTLNPGSAVQLESGGTQDVRVNDKALAATGTGGFSVWSGGAGSSKVATIDGTGLGTFTKANIGAGTTINLYKTVTDTPGAITINTLTCTDRAVALAGSGTGAIIGIAANYALEANIILSPAQVIAGTIHYHICNFTAANITLNAAATFNLMVLQ
jgi:hypothetical protein